MPAAIARAGAGAEAGSGGCDGHFPEGTILNKGSFRSMWLRSKARKCVFDRTLADQFSATPMDVTITDLTDALANTTPEFSSTTDSGGLATPFRPER